MELFFLDHLHYFVTHCPVSERLKVESSAFAFVCLEISNLLKLEISTLLKLENSCLLLFSEGLKFQALEGLKSNVKTDDSSLNRTADFFFVFCHFYQIMKNEIFAYLGKGRKFQIYIYMSEIKRKS